MLVNKDKQGSDSNKKDCHAKGTMLSIEGNQKLIINHMST